MVGIDSYYRRDNPMYYSDFAFPRCGSTSIMHSLYQGIVGHPYNHTGRPYVHEWWKWRGGRSNLLSEQSNPRTPRQHGLWVTRDPLERYVSAYHSKVKCCSSGVPPLRPCMEDTNDAGALVRDLLQLNGNATKLPCLPFRDFVD